MHVRPLFIVLIAVAVASSASGQSTAADTTQTASVATPAVADSTATIAAPATAVAFNQPAAVTRHMAPAMVAAPPAATHAGLGQPRALMVVGGVALVTGAIIGGRAGTVFMVGGAAVGLYGLWEYLQ